MEWKKIKSVLLFLSASSYRSAFNANGDMTTEQTQVKGFAGLYSIVFSIVSLLNKYVITFPSRIFVGLLIAPPILHLIISVFFTKDIIEIANNYKKYYI